MAGIKSLNSIYHKRGLDFIHKLLNSEVIVNTPTDGVFFGFTLIGGDFTFYKKAGNITKIDRLLSIYYEPAIKKIRSKKSTMKSFPENYMFGFEYTSGSKTPLTISYIYDALEKKYIHDKQTLTYYSELFGVLPPPILFEGTLTDEQKVKILDFVYSSSDDLIPKFNTDSFSQFILNTLEVEYPTSHIETIIFRFYPNGLSKDAFVAKLVDPQLRDVQNTMKKKYKSTNDYIYILISELVNYIEHYSISDLDKYVYTNNTYEDNYILLMNKVFREFIGNYGTKYLDIVFNKPDYLKGDEFDINYDLINDEEITRLIGLNENYKEIYKILLNFFRKKRNKTVGIFDERMLYSFNSLVEKINKILLNQDVFESYLPNFKEFTSPLSNINESDIFDIDEDDRQEVNLIIDNFDIINNSHIKLAESVHNKNKLPVVLIVNSEDSRFPEDFRLDLINKCVEAYDFIDSVLILDGTSLSELVSQIDSSMLPKLTITNSNLFQGYLQELNDLKKSEDKTYESMKILDVAIKSDMSKLHDIIANRDFTSFKQETPECIHSYFFKLDNIVNENR